MKRSELRVGDVLYYATGVKWDRPERGTGGGGKVTVVAVEPHKERTMSWSKTDRYFKVASGIGVLVEVPSYLTGGTQQKIVSLGHLRGPYEETAAKVAAWCAERDVHSARLRQLQDECRDALTTAARQVQAAGYPHARLITSTPGAMKASIPVDLFASMAAALHEAGWKYQG